MSVPPSRPSKQALAMKPSPALAPISVVESQMAALAEGDVQRCYQFASPSNKKITGPWQKFEILVRQSPAYAPLVSCSSFEVLSALQLTDSKYLCRVMVKPADSSSAPFAIA